MNTSEFEFSFVFKNKEYKAHCFVYTQPGATEMPYKYPVYRVSVNRHKISPDVFLFYEIKKPNQRFFNYNFAENKAELGEAILRGLNRI